MDERYLNFFLPKNITLLLSTAQPFKSVHIFYKIQTRKNYEKNTTTPFCYSFYSLQ